MQSKIISISVVLLLTLSGCLITSATKLDMTTTQTEMNNDEPYDYEDYYQTYGRNYYSYEGWFLNEGSKGIQLSPGSDWCRVIYKIQIHSGNEGIQDGSLRIRIQYRNEENPSCVQILKDDGSEDGLWVTLDNKMGSKDDTKRWWGTDEIEGDDNNYIFINEDYDDYDSNEVRIRITAEGDGVHPDDWTGEDTTIFRIQIIYQEKDDVDYCNFDYDGDYTHDEETVVKQEFIPQANSLTKIKIGLYPLYNSLYDCNDIINIAIYDQDEDPIGPNYNSDNFIIKWKEYNRVAGSDQFIFMLIDFPDLELVSGKKYYITADINKVNSRVNFLKKTNGDLIIKSYTNDDLTFHPSLNVHIDSIGFSDSTPNLLNPQQVYIENNGDLGSCIEWRASKGPSWIKINDGNTAKGIAYNPHDSENGQFGDYISISVSSSTIKKTFTYQTYYGTVTIIGEGQSATIDVSFTTKGAKVKPKLPYLDFLDNHPILRNLLLSVLKLDL